MAAVLSPGRRVVGLRRGVVGVVGAPVGVSVVEMLSGLSGLRRGCRGRSLTVTMCVTRQALTVVGARRARRARRAAAGLRYGMTCDISAGAVGGSSSCITYTHRHTKQLSQTFGFSGRVKKLSRFAPCLLPAPIDWRHRPLVLVT